MSVAELKTAIRRLNLSERAEIERFVRVLRWVEDPAMPARVGQAHAAIEAGRKVTAQELETRIAADRGSAR